MFENDFIQLIAEKISMFVQMFSTEDIQTTFTSKYTCSFITTWYARCFWRRRWRRHESHYFGVNEKKNVKLGMKKNNSDILTFAVVFIRYYLCKKSFSFVPLLYAHENVFFAWIILYENRMRKWFALPKYTLVRLDYTIQQTGDYKYPFIYTVIVFKFWVRFYLYIILSCQKFVFRILR